jgi:hypothetical protein
MNYLQRMGGTELVNSPFTIHDPASAGSPHGGAQN